MGKGNKIPCRGRFINIKKGKKISKAEIEQRHREGKEVPDKHKRPIDAVIEGGKRVKALDDPPESIHGLAGLV